MIFNSPDRYGKGLDWTGYTVHDAANILRRYLNQLPEPIVPLNCYERFRDPLRAYQANVKTDASGQVMENEEHAKAVRAYQKLITELPALNRQLLLYILDLLAVFASKSDLNRMTAQNLAAIFQPGIISHPSHDMAPNEYRLSQDVLIFLIENQDNFLIGMPGTSMDQKTRDDVKSGPPSIKTPKAAAIGRSASTASAGADSLRKGAGGVRRNGSLSSRNSRDRSSPGVTTPGTPASPSALGSTGSSGGLARSNTVPSNRSPNMQGHRFQRMSETAAPNTPTNNQPPPTIPGSPPDHRRPEDTSNVSSNVPGTDIRFPAAQQARPVQSINTQQLLEPVPTVLAAQDFRPAQDTASTTPISGKPNRDRKISNLLAISPIFGPSDQNRDPNQRQPRKLQKRRIPGSLNESAHSSVASLTAEDGAFHTPMLTPNNLPHERPNPIDAQNPTLSNTVATPVTDQFGNTNTTTSPISPTTRDPRNTSSTLMPPHSPTPSMHSRGSATDPSDLDALDDPVVREEKRRRRFRLSKQDSGPLQPPPIVGQNPGARGSNSSLGSNRPRKSFMADSQTTQTSGLDTSGGGYPSAMNVSSRESTDLLNNTQVDPEKKGFFGRMKNRLTLSKEERQAEKERAKSPPRFGPDQSSRTSLSAFTHEHFSSRGRSFDRPRENSLGVVDERPGHSRTGSRTPVPPMPAQISSDAPVSAPVSAPPFHASQQSASEAGPSRAATVPTTAPLMAATPGPVPILTPGPPNDQPSMVEQTSNETVRPRQHERLPSETQDHISQGQPMHVPTQPYAEGTRPRTAEQPVQAGELQAPREVQQPTSSNATEAAPFTDTPQHSRE